MIGDYRQPLWPENIIGSISHSDNYCAVAVAPVSVLTSLGLDVEPYEGLDPEVADVVLTERELASTAQSDRELVKAGCTAMGARAHKLIFSIKEAAYKCCYPQVRAFIDFKQCEVTLDVNARTYTAVIDCNHANGLPMHLEVSGRWMVECEHIFASAEY